MKIDRGADCFIYLTVLVVVSRAHYIPASFLNDCTSYIVVAYFWVRLSSLCVIDMGTTMFLIAVASETDVLERHLICSLFATCVWLLAPLLVSRNIVLHGTN